MFWTVPPLATRPDARGLDLSLRVGGDVGEVDLTGDRGVDARLRVEDRPELVRVERVVGRVRVVFLLHEQVRVALDGGVGVDRRAGPSRRGSSRGVERSAAPVGPTIAPAGMTRFASKPGLGAAKVRVTVSSSTTVTSVISFSPPAAKPLYAERSGSPRASRFCLDELGAERRAVVEGRAGVEVERELRLVFVVLEVRHEVGNDLAVLVEHEQRVVDALEEHALAAAVAHAGRSRARPGRSRGR